MFFILTQINFRLTNMMLVKVLFQKVLHVRFIYIIQTDTQNHFLYIDHNHYIMITEININKYININRLIVSITIFILNSSTIF